ncbi:unnamed protein product [Discula destructiva]
MSDKSIMLTGAPYHVLAYGSLLGTTVYMRRDNHPVSNTPKTCIAERRRQEKKDGKMSWDPAPHSEEMATLNKKFGILHGISSLLNVVHFVATIVYGVTLAGRIN